MLFSYGMNSKKFMGHELLLILAFDPKSNTDPIAMEKVISRFYTLFPHSALILIQL